MNALMWIGRSLAGLVALAVVLLLLSIPFGPEAFGYAVGYGIGWSIRYVLPPAVLAGLAFLTIRRVRRAA